MGDPAGRQRGLCGQHGRRAGGLSEAARSAASARVPRRNLEAADHRDARADPREAGTQGASRLRIRTQWRRQSVHGVRPAGRVAACESDRPPHRHRLCPYAQGFVGDRKSTRLNSSHLGISYAVFCLKKKKKKKERKLCIPVKSLDMMGTAVYLYVVNTVCTYIASNFLQVFLNNDEARMSMM